MPISNSRSEQPGTAEVVSITSGRKPRPHAAGEYLLVELALPGEGVRNAGVMLRDPESGRLYAKMRADWEGVGDPEERELLEALDQDFQTRIGELGGDAFLHSLEDSLSNTLRLTERTSVAVDDYPATLARLYAEHVEAAVRPFVTHLPLYTLEAAATKFGEDREVEDAGWVKAPSKLRLTEDMFVARVVGRSMEPRIPDGSLCVFRAGVVGSRQGKLLLVERLGATETSARYTIKKYTSEKTFTDTGEWEHAAIRLEPLNPEFESFPLHEGEARVIAEFVQVLE